MSTRDRFVSTASMLFQRQGFGATSVGEIAEAGDLPIGSLYYYFPGGKEALGAAAVEHGANSFGQVLDSALRSTEVPGDALATCASVLADRLEAGGWVDGCPVATVALETVSTSPELQGAATAGFRAWVKVVADRLIELGVDRERADELGVVTIAMLEGTEMIARVTRSREPLEVAARTLGGLV